MTLFLTNFLAALPLFGLIAFGYFCCKVGMASPAMGKALGNFSFNIAIPVLLFRLMSDITHQSSPDWLIAVAFFGSCFIVFFVGRIIGRRFLGLNADGQTIFGMANVFSNNVQLGIPVTLAILGAEAMPSIAVIFSLNGFLMWTLVTVAIELGRSRQPSIGATLRHGILSTLKNPIVVAIIAGFLWSLTSIELPKPVASCVDMLADCAAPVALFGLGVGMTQYRLTSSLRVTAVIVLMKLALQPLAVFFLGCALGLSHQAMQATCLMACLPVGVNVYIMAQHFNVMEEAVANALLVTTCLSFATLPLVLSLLGLL